MTETNAHNAANPRPHRRLAKAALVTGLGTAVILGGGGTFAVWNTNVNAEAGLVQAGDLDMKEVAPGIWSSSISGEIADISQFKVVPGETLTFTQDLDLTLEGNNLAATLVPTGTGVNQGFLPENVVVDERPTLVGSSGQILATDQLRESDVVTASMDFEFLKSTDLRDSTNASYDYSGVGYLLKQTALTSDVVAEWQAKTEYAAGDRAIIDGRVFKAVTGGTSGDTAPTPQYNAIPGEEWDDGTIFWTVVA